MPEVNADPHANDYNYQPTYCVTAIFPTGTDMHAVRSSLLSSGYADEEMQVLSGEQGSAQLDINAENQGLFTKVRRAFDKILSDQTTVIEQIDRVLKRGGGAVILKVGVADEDEQRQQKAQQAAIALHRLGGKELWYWGQLSLERMSGEPEVV